MNQTAPQLTLTPPNQRVRLGTKKFAELKRSQDVIETLAWFTVVLVVAMFLLDGGIALFGNLTDALGAISRLHRTGWNRPATHSHSAGCPCAMAG
jgi:hypothetical protein